MSQVHFETPYCAIRPDGAIDTVRVSVDGTDYLVRLDDNDKPYLVGSRGGRPRERRQAIAAATRYILAERKKKE